MQVAFSLAVASPVAYPPILAVDSGVGAKVYASYVSGADTDVLTFKYLVVEDDNNPTFDVWDDDALETQGNGYLRRVSDLPSVDADVSLAAARAWHWLSASNTPASVCTLLGCSRLPAMGQKPNFDQHPRSKQG